MINIIIYLALLIKKIINLALYAYQILLIVRAVMSWIPGADLGAFGNFIFTVTEPLLGAVRRILHKSRFMRELPIDLSFIVAFIIIDILLILL